MKLKNIQYIQIKIVKAWQISVCVLRLEYTSYSLALKQRKNSQKAGLILTFESLVPSMDIKPY